MRRLTFDSMLRNASLTFADLAVKKLQPKPFPGRTAPTRVLWHYLFRVPLADATGLATHEEKTLSYFGKPSRYRAIEALRSIKSDYQPLQKVEAEFDRNGLIAYRIWTYHNGLLAFFNPVYLAYHPQGDASVNIVSSFAHPLFVKRIGGFHLYSQTKKISVERVEAFYTWWASKFSKKLRRPKARALELSSEDFEQ